MHASFWSTIAAKLLSDIMKFNGKPSEDPKNHFMTFHLWLCSNYLMDDSIRIRIFKIKLIGAIVKWYIELSCNSFANFSSLSMDFLMHFQFPIWYDTGIELLTLSDNPLPQTYSIIFMSGDGGDS
jgi:hypothetical protein